MSKNIDSSKDILKSTGLIGGSNIFTILIRVVQNKVVAILLGPTGVGIVSLFNSTISAIQSLSSLGLNISAVREVSISLKDEIPEAASKVIKT